MNVIRILVTASVAADLRDTGVTANVIAPGGPADTRMVVADIPRAGPHAAKSIALGENGELFVHVGSPTNACQPQAQDRRPNVPGEQPCSTLDLYGGVWTLGPGELHPLALLFVLSGTLMISKTLRIPKF